MRFLVLQEVPPVLGVGDGGVPELKLLEQLFARLLQRVLLSRTLLPARLL